MRSDEKVTVTPGRHSLILALARAGATTRAWAEFVEAGYERQRDPASLTLGGRLLKDRARSAEAAEQKRALYRDAAACYAAAASAAGGTYPLINAASLSLLGGDPAASKAYAERVLANLEAAPDEPETPYWRAATLAEAYLLLGREKAARTALAEAISVSPRAWEDHASTLRQFRLILEAQGRNAAWLDRHRPPRSLHFGGHMSFHPEVERREHLDGVIAALLKEEKVGFGYGALAAGADIIIAEALAARGAELHAVLPGGAQAFASVSVDPFGASWRRRFDALIEQAETVRPVRPIGHRPGPHMISLADEIAMGAAAMNALRLESEAIQLLVADGEGGGVRSGGATARAQRIWAASHRRQRLVKAPRESVDASRAGEGSEAGKDRAIPVIAIAAPQGADDLEQWLGSLRQAMADAPNPIVAPHWLSGRVLLALEGVQHAADLALSLADGGYRVGADHCAAALFQDPFSGGARLQAAAAGAAEAAAASTPEGSVCATEDFAAALAARGAGSIRAEYVGELDPPHAGPPLGLYVLKR